MEHMPSQNVLLQVFFITVNSLFTGGLGESERTTLNSDLR